MPARTEQAWRFASHRQDRAGPATTPPQPVDAATRERLIGRSIGNEKTAGKMVFANDTLLDRRVHAAGARRAGRHLEAARSRHRPSTRTFSASISWRRRRSSARRNSPRCTAAHVRTGTFLYVPKNVEVALPLEVFHWLSGEGGSTFPHTLIIAEAGSKVTLVDYFESDRDGGSRVCLRGERSDRRARREGDVSLRAELGRKSGLASRSTRRRWNATAAALSLHLNLGASYARLESLSRLAGAGGRSDMLAATVAEGTQEFDQRTLQDHLEPHTTSDLLYKNSLSDASKTIFAGLIRVATRRRSTPTPTRRCATSCSATTRRPNSMPGLEILADEVRCTHGATSGHVDEEELFYLLSRGIDPQTRAGIDRPRVPQRGARTPAGHERDAETRRAAGGEIRADEASAACGCGGLTACVEESGHTVFAPAFSVILNGASRRAQSKNLPAGGGQARMLDRSAALRAAAGPSTALADSLRSR